MANEVKAYLQQLGRDRFAWAGICFLLAALAIVSPLWPGNTIEHLGGLLIWTGIIEMFDGFKRLESVSVRSARFSGALSLLMGTLLINASLFQRNALVVFVIGVFIIDAIRY